MNRHDGSDGSRSGIGRKRNSSHPSDSDSVELPTSLTIPLFDLHWIVTLLVLLIPTPLPIPSLVCFNFREYFIEDARRGGWGGGNESGKVKGSAYCQI